jgi:hypothetical protein
MVSLLLLTAAATLWVPKAIRNATVNYWYRKCLTYRAPAGQVIMEAGRSLVPPPLSWARYAQVDAHGPPPAFLHARQNRHGRQRLVTVLFDSDGQMWRVESRQSVLHMGEAAIVDRDATRHARIFAGQPDPQDLSHFTIPIEFISGPRAGQRDVIDGWLLDDGRTVRLQARSTQGSTTSRLP